MEASAHVNSLAARVRILRALPGQLTAARLAVDLCEHALVLGVCSLLAPEQKYNVCTGIIDSTNAFVHNQPV